MKILPVVHINEVSTAVDQGEKAFEAGADGVFLIDHHNCAASTDNLFEVFNRLRTDDDKRFIGINILGLGGLSALKAVDFAIDYGDLLRAPDALWYDNARNALTLGDAMEFRDNIANVAAVRLMGGVAFKYTPEQTNHPESAFAEAADLKGIVDIVTTSGLGTGEPPSVAKIARMRAAIGEQELAIASGINVSNIRSFEPFVDQVLVSTSIETEPQSGVFDMNAMRALVERAHELAR
jgi:predicted TIM-barrel enzyme